MKESKKTKVEKSREDELMSTPRSQPVNLPGARSVLNEPLGFCDAAELLVENVS